MKNDIKEFMAKNGRKGGKKRWQDVPADIRSENMKKLRAMQTRIVIPTPPIDEAATLE